MLEVLKKYSWKYEAETSIIKNQPNIFAIESIVAKMKGTEGGLRNRIELTKSLKSWNLQESTQKALECN